MIVTLEAIFIRQDKLKYHFQQKKIRFHILQGEDTNLYFK